MTQEADTEHPDAAFTTEESGALRLDAADALASWRDEFFIPSDERGRPLRYFCGNSLGLQPVRARSLVIDELDKWATLAVNAHFADDAPWYSYHELFRETGARLVGARPGEVVMMNSLTVNLHLMMVTFYRPTRERPKILMEAPAFPSDTYAIRTQIRERGYDPDEVLVVIEPREGESIVREEDIEAALEREGSSIALVLLAGVNFLTGQFFDIPRLTEAAHRHGCRFGLDLAHAAGNLPLQLHDWDVDFAVWCTYKYLNSSPGAIAGCFVHERWTSDTSLVRFGGWWGNDPETRFRMHLEPEFIPRASADGWQLSNPPILAMAPLRASLEIFDSVGMSKLREKSLRLTGYLRFLLRNIDRDDLEILTPDEPDRHGCQLSIRFRERPRETFQEIESQGCVGDFREPDVLRVAPVPLYNTFHDVWTLANAIGARTSATPREESES